MAVSVSGITLSGVFSSIDTDKLVQASLLAAQGPLKQLSTQESQVKARQKALSDIESRLNDLSDIVAKLSDASQLQAVSASSSSSTTVGVSASGATAEGSYQVLVNRLATADRLVQTTGLAGADSLVGAGQFVYSYGGTTLTRTTTAATTLQGLADLINKDSANPGVTATLLTAGGTSHLVLSGKDAGAGHAITIDDEQTTIAGFDTADFTETQAAQNAQIRVDGYPAATWIERDSNRITDVIPGATLTLSNTGTATVTLSRDTSSIAEDLNNLVAIYNGLTGKIAAYTGYDSTNKTAGVMQGDMTIRSITDTIRSLLSGVVPGFAAGTDTYTGAPDLGFSLDRYGTLSLDSTKLNDALADNYAAVLKVLSASGTGTSSNSHVQFTSASTSVPAGQYDVEVLFGESGTVTSARARKHGTGDWVAMDIDGDTLVGQEDTLAEGLVLTALGAGAGGTTQSATVTVQKGFAGQIKDAVSSMLKTDTGLIDVAANGYDTQVTALEKKIEQQNDRLSKMETTLKDKYARMESLLAQLNSMQGQFNALFSSLDSSSSSSSSKSSS